MNDFIIQALSPQFDYLLVLKIIADGLMELKYFENNTLSEDCG